MYFTNSSRSLLGLSDHPYKKILNVLKTPLKGPFFRHFLWEIVKAPATNVAWLLWPVRPCILPTFFCSLIPYFFRLSSSVSLHCHRMCSSVSFALQIGQSGSGIPSITVCGPTVTNSQSGHRHLTAPFQLLSVILPTRVLLSLFHHSPPLPTFFVGCPPFPS
jgi:hypothetical protein